MGFKWPEQIEERPLLLKLDGNTAHFKVREIRGTVALDVRTYTVVHPQDGSKAEVDAIILCTGYLHSYPFLRENLRLKCGNVLYTPDLYKGVLLTKGGNNRLMYVSSQDQFYTFTMFDAQVTY